MSEDLDDKIGKAEFLMDLEVIKAECYDLHILEQLVFIKKMIVHGYDELSASDIWILYQELAKLEQRMYFDAREYPEIKNALD